MGHRTGPRQVSHKITEQALQSCGYSGGAVKGVRGPAFEEEIDERREDSKRFR